MDLLQHVNNCVSGDFISICAGVGGGWRSIVKMNISAGDDCPGNWRKETQFGVTFCRVASNDSFTCSSANFSTNGASYQRVCGRARGYQKGYTLGFYGSDNSTQLHNNRSIDEDYVSGLSITYSSSPRQHIWTFASGYSEIDNSFIHNRNYPCSIYSGNYPSSFVGSNYYCKSGSVFYPKSGNVYYFNDALWDGASCTGGTCCNHTIQP